VREFARGEDRRGLLTIVTADHGEAFGERGWRGHNRSVFEEEVRIPLVMHWPGVVAPGQRIAPAVHLIDVLPTVLSATRVDAGTPKFDGIDLLPAVTGGSALDPERMLFLQRPYYETRRRARRRDMIGFGFGVRQGRWKHLEARDEGQQSLFDVEVDPGERRDLAAARPDHVQQLSAAIASWRARFPESGSAAPTRMPPEMRSKLRALGYAE
jgi:arylsulfatase A-like enzyme